MPDWSQVHSPDVVTAIEEHDRLGAKDFLGRYGFRRSRSSTLWRGGNEYDARAILGAAYQHATGEAPTWDDTGEPGESGPAKVLRDLGFDVVVEEPPVVPARRKAAPVRKRVVAPEPVIRLCPKCNVAVPSTGVCDSCD